MNGPLNFKTLAEWRAYQQGRNEGLRSALETQDEVRLPSCETNMECPCCDDGKYLHHYEITCFERAEDAATCQQTTITAEGTKVTVTDGRGNPSSRRHGCVVEMWCEICGGRSRMTCAQHKGHTLISHVCIEADPTVEGEEHS